MCRDPKFKTYVCLNCGRDYADDTAGCYVDGTCAACTPSGGRCLDCRDARREDEADRNLRLSREARDWA